ncbi:MAG TPA: hypothetical protein PK655_00120 [archaeon]|jgi:methionyl-tRNA synthetase|nr:hypothetical protein [archaeon]HPV65849.1 hypothetical protein [archaeon]
MKTRIVTIALPFVNNVPRLGHLFLRTPREIHHKIVQEFLDHLYNNNCITEKIIEILYTEKEILS